ncbi:hypothetical protein [Streptomyces sp. CLI2509]|uniref:hypothetical protein n=2 Tax=unclassified Streptomyces TaxID=2593676 RepID=UPI000BAC4E57|nr:hypothetical protein [Streptomyces sp. CLI2509]ASY35360.1 hypothetical protein CAC01_23990 [Streptomyces sp. CLI2509]
MARSRPLRPRPGRAAALALLLLLGGCAGGGGESGGDTGTRVRAVLDARGDAVRDGDRADWLATAAPGSARERAGTVFTNLDALRPTAWAYRVTSVRPEGDRAAVRATLSYRVEGYDSAPVTVRRALTLRRVSGRWYVSADKPAPGAPQQLWEQGRMTAVRGADSLVLGVGQPRAKLADVAGLADDAVPAVRRVWPERWAGRLIVLLPASLDRMAALLGEKPADYRGIAAVTTGELGSAAHVPADRVTVNPEAYEELGAFGKRFVLIHEATHVATRSATTAATPLWLSEGFADWSGYHGSGRTPRQVAPELAEAVREGEAPDTLPTDADFAFSGDPGRLARAYEGGWLTCRMIAEQWGEPKLRDFYRAVGEHEGRDGAVAAAARKVLGVDEAELVGRWRGYVREQLA